MRSLLRKFRYRIAATAFKIRPACFLQLEPAVPMLLGGFSTNGKARCLGVDLGWIKNISVPAAPNPFEVGHFGIATDVLRIGVGSAMFSALRVSLACPLNQQQILFPGIEPASSRSEFLSKLGAVQHGIPNAAGFVSYLW